MQAKTVPGSFSHPHARPILDLDSVESRFHDVVMSESWRRIESMFVHADWVAIVGVGGNLAIAQHGASDLTSLTGKQVTAPAGLVEMSETVNSSGFESWIPIWLDRQMKGKSAEETSRALVVGLTCSGSSRAVLPAIRWSIRNGMAVALISVAEPSQALDCPVVTVGTDYYHVGEMVMALLLYQLAVANGQELRRIGSEHPVGQTQDDDAK